MHNMKLYLTGRQGSESLDPETSGRFKHNMQQSIKHNSVQLLQSDSL